MKTFKELLQTHQPELYKKITAPQHNLSKTIVSYRILMGATIEEMSELLNLSIKDYLSYEYGDLEFTVDEYEEVISKLEMIAMENAEKSVL